MALATEPELQAGDEPDGHAATAAHAHRPESFGDGRPGLGTTGHVLSCRACEVRVTERGFPDIAQLGFSGVAIVCLAGTISERGWDISSIHIQGESLNKALGFIAMSALLLTGCSVGGSATSASSGPAASASASTDAKYVPDVTGQTPGQADNILGLAGVDYDYYQDGSLVTSGSAVYGRLVISSTEPKAGETVPAGTRVKINAVAKPQAVPTSKPSRTGYAATVPEKFPGYPLIVHSATLDYRIKSAFEGKLVDDQVVALAPGLYTPYNPRVTDLSSYYNTGVYGDNAIKNAYMPEAGGSMWDGVLPGPEEPK